MAEKFEIKAYFPLIPDYPLATVKEIISQQKFNNILQKSAIDFPQGELYEVIKTHDNNLVDVAKYSAFEYNYSTGGVPGGTNVGGDLWLPEGQGTSFGARLDYVGTIVPGSLSLMRPGDMVEVCFYDRNRQRPYIKRILKRGQMVSVESIYGGTLLWTQSEGWSWLPCGPRHTFPVPQLIGLPTIYAVIDSANINDIKWTGLVYDNGNMDGLATVYSGSDATGLRLIHNPADVLPETVDIPFIHPFVADSGLGPNNGPHGWQSQAYGFLYVDNVRFYSVVTPEGVRFVSEGTLLPRTLNFTPDAIRPSQDMNVSISGDYILQGSWPSLQTVSSPVQDFYPDEVAQPYFPLNTMLYGWKRNASGGIDRNWSISMRSLCGAIPDPKNIISCGLPNRHLPTLLYPQKFSLLNARWPMNPINNHWLIGVIVDSLAANTLEPGRNATQNPGPADDTGVYELEKGLPDGGLVWNLVNGLDGSILNSYTILGSKAELYHRPALRAEQQARQTELADEDYAKRLAYITGTLADYKLYTPRYGAYNDLALQDGLPSTFGEGWKLYFDSAPYDAGGNTVDFGQVQMEPTWHPLTMYGEDLGTAGTYAGSYVPGRFVGYQILKTDVALFIANQAIAWDALSAAHPGVFDTYRVTEWPPSPLEITDMTTMTIELHRNWTYTPTISKLVYDGTYKAKTRIPAVPFNAPSYNVAPKTTGDDYGWDPPTYSWPEPEPHAFRAIPGGRITEDGTIYTIHILPKWVGSWMNPTEAENSVGTGQFVPVTDSAKIEWCAWNYRIKAEDIEWDYGTGYGWWPANQVSYLIPQMADFPRRYNHGHEIREKKVSNLQLVASRSVCETWIKVFDAKLTPLWEKNISQLYIYDPDKDATVKEINHTATALLPLHTNEYQVYDYQVVGRKLFILLNRFYEITEGSVITLDDYALHKEKPFLDVYDLDTKVLLDRIDLKQSFGTEVFEMPAMRCGQTTERNEWAYVVVPDGLKAAGTPKCRRTIVSYNGLSSSTTNDVGNMYTNTVWPTCINIHNSMFVDEKIYWLDNGGVIKSGV